jgi:hypothetical protein
MSRRRQSASIRAFGGAAAITLAALASVHAQPVSPDQIAYEMRVKDDPAVKTCVLGLAIKGGADETVDFQLVVARMKRADVVAGPAVFGFTINVHDRQPTPRRNTASRAIEITSAALVSDHYTAAARRRTDPFADGSWVASTLDAGDGSELLDVAASGKFQIAYTRTRPSAARVVEVASTPPRDVLLRFTGCLDGLQATE